MRWERHNDKSEDLKKKKDHMYFKMIAKMHCYIQTSLTQLFYKLPSRYSVNFCIWLLAY